MKAISPDITDTRAGDTPRATGHCAWLQSRGMREPTPDPRLSAHTSQRVLTERVFEVGESAAERLAQLVPAVDVDRTEYAVSTLLLEEAWVVQR